MAWDDVLAAVGGGAEAAGKQQNFLANLKKQEDMAQLHADLQMLAEAGRNYRSDTGNDTKVDIAGANNTTKENVAGATNTSRETVADANNTTRRDIAKDANTTRTSIADANRANNMEQFWGSTDPARWAGFGETVRRDNMASADRRFGITTGADTAAAGRAVTQRGQNLTDQRGRAGLQIQQDKNWFAPAGSNKIDLANPNTMDTAPIATPAPAAPLPVRPAGAAAAPAAPAAAPAAAPKLPPGLVVGATVTLKDGSKHVVKAIDPVTGDITY